MPVRIIETTIDVLGQGFAFDDRDVVYARYEALHPEARVELEFDDVTLELVAVHVIQPIPVDLAA